MSESTALEYRNSRQIPNPQEAILQTVERLHQFIEESGCEIAGVHEEEYLTRPTAKVQKTIIRYPIRRR